MLYDYADAGAELDRKAVPLSSGASDSKDALIIADLVVRGQYLGFVELSDICLELRALVNLRARLVKEQTGWFNALHQTVDVLFPEFETVFPDLKRPSARLVLGRFGTVGAVRAHSAAEMRRLLIRDGAARASLAKLKRLKAAGDESIGPLAVSAGQERSLSEMLATLAVLERRIAGLAEIARLLEQLPEARYLMSVKGVGAMTAAVILAETGGLGQYSCAAAVLKLAGLNSCIRPTRGSIGAAGASRSGAGRSCGGRCTWWRCSTPGAAGRCSRTMPGWWRGASRRTLR